MLPGQGLTDVNAPGVREAGPELGSYRLRLSRVGTEAEDGRAAAGDADAGTPEIAQACLNHPDDGTTPDRFRFEIVPQPVSELAERAVA